MSYTVVDAGASLVAALSAPNRLARLSNTSLETAAVLTLVGVSTAAVPNRWARSLIFLSSLTAPPDAVTPNLWALTFNLAFSDWQPNFFIRNSNF